MNIIKIIEKKAEGLELTKEEIEYFVQGYTNNEIADYQISSLLMAIYLNGMTDSEATELTISMLNSGEEIDLSTIDGFKVDKHSTGGVGDKATLVIAPLVASLGVKVAKMSGRGLGHTGGTLDKLESIKGYNINISIDQVHKQVNDINIAIVGQSGNLAPADKKLYALRDVTGTVSSIPLIASSIMSKKLASGADIISLDVKVGKGAFMKDLDQAKKLASLMVQIGKNCGKKISAILTDMEQPLGNAVGNALEVKEAIDTLRGKGPKDLHDLSIEVASQLVLDAKVAKTLEEAKMMLEENIANNKAILKFKELLSAQGASELYADDFTLFDQAKEIVEVKSTKEGYVNSIDALAIGNAAMLLGAGRKTIEDKIDYAVGIVLNKKVGDFVKVNETLFEVHTNGKDTKKAIELSTNAFNITNEKVTSKLIIDKIL